MTITFNRKALTAALKTVTPALPKLVNNPILTGVLIETSGGRAALTCTNLDLTITTRLDAEGDDGDAVVSASVLARIVGRLTGDEVCCELDDDRSSLNLSSGRAKARLPTMPVAEWPHLKPLAGERFKLTPDDLDVIRRVTPAASDDTSRPALCGVHLEGTTVTATTSYHAARGTVPTEMPALTVPSTSLAAVLAQVDGELDVQHHIGRVCLSDGTTSWTARLIEEQYPNVERLIPTDPVTKVTAPVSQLLDAIRSAETTRRDDGPLHFTINEGEIVVRCVTLDVGDVTVSVDAEVDGPAVELVGYNPKFLVPLLQAVTEPEVTLDIVDHMKPMVIREGAWLGMIMPVRISTL